MSYHDGYNPHHEGIAVVNPLLEQRKRLTQLEQFLLEVAEETNDETLKAKIEQILKTE
jgi:hypothetical protein